MAKIPTYNALPAWAADDAHYVVDVSDTTDDATGSSRSTTSSALFEWLPAAAWTYASASTFTVAGDVTALYRKGTKLKFTQTTVKYAIVAGSSYSSPNTTVTIIVSADYTLANAAISANYISYIANPSGWPHWFNWTPTITGYSSAPSGGVYQFKSLGGDELMCTVREPNNGTSNATTVTISAPVAALTLTGANWFGPCVYVDNGSVGTAYGDFSIPSAQTVFTAATNPNAGAWTNSGNKRVARANIVYRF